MHAASQCRDTAAVPQPTIRLPFATRISDMLFLVVLSLILLSSLGQASKYLLGHPKLKGFVPTFYVDYESTIPTWYSSAALGLSAMLLAVIAAASWKQRRMGRVHWLLLSLLFLLLSADEIAMLHELPIDPLRETFHFGGALYYPWVIPAAVFVAALGLFYLPFVLRLPRPTRTQILLAGLTYLAGAIGVEMVSGMQADVCGEENLTYALIITVEEFLEMLGVAIFIKALLLYIETEFKGLRIAFALPSELERRAPNRPTPK